MSSSCCRPGDYDKIFDDRHARARARDYARHGLTGDSRRIFDFVRERLPGGYDVLEVGGGIGEIQLEMLRSGGAMRATNVELATRYEETAGAVISDLGLTGRVERRLGDFVREAEAVPAADVVVMNRVVCCYPDADALVGAAARHARRILAMTLPVDRWWIRLGLMIGNSFLALRTNTFRGYAHPTRAVIAAVTRDGFGVSLHRRGAIWQLIALERRG